MKSRLPDRIDFRQDDLSGEPIRQLIAQHLRGMHQHSPPESVHAFDIDKLRLSGVTFWSAWINGEIAGCGALKRLEGGDGEIKLMRVADAFLGHGVGRAMLEHIEHIVAEARVLGLRRLWLETGSANAFLPARKLYGSAGFERCEPFGSYVADPFSAFMSRKL